MIADNLHIGTHVGSLSSDFHQRAGIFALVNDKWTGAIILSRSETAVFVRLESGRELQCSPSCIWDSSQSTEPPNHPESNQPSNNEDQFPKYEYQYHDNSSHHNNHDNRSMNSRSTSALYNSHSNVEFDYSANNSNNEKPRIGSNSLSSSSMNFDVSMFDSRRSSHSASMGVKSSSIENSSSNNSNNMMNSNSSINLQSNFNEFDIGVFNKRSENGGVDHNDDTSNRNGNIIYHSSNHESSNENTKYNNNLNNSMNEDDNSNNNNSNDYSYQEPKRSTSFSGYHQHPQQSHHQYHQHNHHQQAPRLTLTESGNSDLDQAPSSFDDFNRFAKESSFSQQRSGRMSSKSADFSSFHQSPYGHQQHHLEENKHNNAHSKQYFYDSNMPQKLMSRSTEFHQMTEYSLSRSPKHISPQYSSYNNNGSEFDFNSNEYSTGGRNSYGERGQQSEYPSRPNSQGNLQKPTSKLKSFSMTDFPVGDRKSFSSSHKQHVVYEEEMSNPYQTSTSPYQPSDPFPQQLQQKSNQYSFHSTYNNQNTPDAYHLHHMQPQMQVQQQQFDLQQSIGQGQRKKGQKCRKRYGLDKKDQWCTKCKWKKACERFI